MKMCVACKRIFLTDRDFLTNTHQWRMCELGNLWFNCTCGSTLMLPKGKYPWYDPKKSMSKEALSVFNQISNISALPHIPHAVMKVQELLNDPNVETAVLVKAIKQDPFLGTEIIKVAENLRNARSSNRTSITSLDFAIHYIGKKTLKEMVLTASIKSFKLPTKIFQDQIFWKHSFISASIAETLAKKYLSKDDFDHVYLAACLANLGKIVGSVCFPEKVDQVQNYVMNPKTMINWEEAEQTFQMFSHCLLGEIGGVLWGLPLFMTDAIRYHHSKLEEINLNTVVGFSCLLAHWVMLEPSRINPGLLAHYQNIFSVNENVIETWIFQEFLPLVRNMSL